MPAAPKGGGGLQLTKDLIEFPPPHPHSRGMGKTEPPGAWAGRLCSGAGEVKSGRRTPPLPAGWGGHSLSRPGLERNPPGAWAGRPCSGAGEVKGGRRTPPLACQAGGRSLSRPPHQRGLRAAPALLHPPHGVRRTEGQPPRSGPRGGPQLDSFDPPIRHDPPLIEPGGG
jgi:hypothetical protein